MKVGESYLCPGLNVEFFVSREVAVFFCEFLGLKYKYPPFMKIKVLKDVVINQIAAGEVVDRPASVVRELVENSVDAGAHEIRVTLEDGGRQAIIVQDDGSGMEHADALLAFERHATSKISDSEDLLHIASLGFRGEALASIASVAKVTLRTRASSEDVGTEVKINGGVLANVGRVPGAVGAQIEVRRLFFNTPARRNFLKRPETEARRVRQWLLGFSLGHPSVHFRFVENEKEVLNLPPSGSSLERASELLRGDVVPCELADTSLSLSALVAHPALARSDLSGLTTVVNGRVVSDRLLNRAVRDGFCSTLKDREYPVGVLLLTLPPELVDMNVHPQKSEVRFRHEREVVRAVREGIQSAVFKFRSPLSETPRAGVSWSERSRVAEIPAKYKSEVRPASERSESTTVPREQAAFSYQAKPSPESPSIPSSQLTQNVAQGVAQSTIQSPSESSSDSFRFSALRYLGKVLDCYLLCEDGDKFVVVDMHAAHERVNYNLIRSRYKSGTLEAQTLLLPVSVYVGEDGLERCLQAHHTLERFGFSVEEFGGDTVIVRSVPAILGSVDVESLFKELASEILNEFVESRIEEFIDHTSARLACHASVRSGDKLERAEVYALFEALDRHDFSAACPHGRPVVVSFKRMEVEQWFGRDR